MNRLLKCHRKLVLLVGILVVAAILLAMNRTIMPDYILTTFNPN